MSQVYPAFRDFDVTTLSHHAYGLEGTTIGLHLVSVTLKRGAVAGKLRDKMCSRQSKAVKYLYICMRILTLTN